MNKALTLGDVKEAVWKGQPPSVAPTDPIISRVLKAKLRMSYRRLSKHPLKILRGDHVRSFWEAVMIQTILRSNLYELIYIDEFKVNIHNDTINGWVYKNKISIATFPIDAFSMLFITDSNMETGLQLGSDLLQVGSQMMDLTWSNKDPSNKTVTISETVILMPSQISIYMESLEINRQIVLTFLFTFCLDL